ncbi:restriction endonuclease subunit S [Candidatus Enterenecus avicola]
MSNDTQPEIRFPGFTDDWEQRKLGEVVQIVMGQSPNSENYTDNPNDYILVQGNADMKNNRVVPRVWTTQVTKQAEKGDLILSVRAPVGDIGKTDYDVVLGRGVAAIKGNDFIFQQLGKMKENGYWNRYSTGSTFESINSNDIREALITIPDVKEQQKIGAFFKQLDDTIALHQRKLDLLKETKKGFLQKMFPKNGAKVPEIRFPGFTEDWEERRLSDVASIVGGGTPSTSNPEYWDGDIDWYAPAEIGDQIYVSKSLKTITELGQQKSSAKILPIGTVLFTSRAGIGNTAILAKEGTTNQGFQSIVPHKNKLDSYFIFSRTHELKRYGEVTGAGSTFAEVSGKQMAKMPILIPCINEQRKIGAFFEQLDTTITLHQRELDVLKETKKGFLQKMFV